MQVILARLRLVGISIPDESTPCWPHRKKSSWNFSLAITHRVTLLTHKLWRIVNLIKYKTQMMRYVLFGFFFIPLLSLTILLDILAKVGREDMANGVVAFVCVSTNEKCL